MRALSLVVVAESIVLVPLFVVWLMVEPASGALPAGLDAERPDREPARLVAASSATDNASVEAPPVRTPVVDAAATSTHVVVHGRLLAADAAAPPVDANVSFRAGSTWRTASSNREHFALSALTRGPWTVRAQADGFATYEAEHTVGHESIQHVALTLQRAQRVKVFLRTADGSPFAPALVQAGLLRGLQVVATERALDRDLPPTDSAWVGDLDAGRYRATNDRSGTAPGEGEPDGELQLDRPAPVHASLLVRHVVLARQTIAPAQEELAFVVDIDDVLAKLGTLRLRLVDGGSGEPLPGVMVRVATSQGGGSGGKTAADGRLVVERVLPGLATLQAQSKGCEPLWTLARVPTGGTLDLGDVVLHPVVTLSGRVLDGDGKPIAGAVQWTPLDTMTFPRELIDRRSSATDAEGKFSLLGGRRRYVVIARAQDGQVGVAVADGGSATTCEIRVAPPVTIRVVARGSRLVGYVATVRDRLGVPIAAQSIEPRWREQTLRVPPGEYTLEVHDDADRLVLSRAIVARDAQIDVEVGG